MSCCSDEILVGVLTGPLVAAPKMQGVVRLTSTATCVSCSSLV